MDCSCLNVAKLREYFEKEFEDCKKQGILLSLHLKATMMKVSDPIIFGHAVSVYFKDVFSTYEAEFKELGVNPNLGLGDLYKKIAKHAKKAEIEAAIEEAFTNRPRLAMVNAAKKITNLHVSSDVIMWNAEDKPEGTKALIPDRCYSSVFQTCIDFCKQNGNFDVSTMGTVPNVGLMAQKA